MRVDVEPAAPHVPDEGDPQFPADPDREVGGGGARGDHGDPERARLRRHLRGNAPRGDEDPAREIDSPQERLPRDPVDRVVPPDILGEEEEPLAVPGPGGVDPSAPAVRLGRARERVHRRKKRLRGNGRPRGGELDRAPPGSGDVEADPGAAPRGEGRGDAIGHVSPDPDRGRAEVFAHAQGQEVAGGPDQSLHPEETGHQEMQVVGRGDQRSEGDAVDREGDGDLPHGEMPDGSQPPPVVPQDGRGVPALRVVSGEAAHFPLSNPSFPARRSRWRVARSTASSGTSAFPRRTSRVFRYRLHLRHTPTRVGPSPAVK